MPLVTLMSIKAGVRENGHFHFHSLKKSCNLHGVQVTSHDLDLNDAVLSVDPPRLVFVKGEYVPGRGQNDDGAVARGDPVDLDVLLVEGRDQLRVWGRLLALEMAQLAGVQTPREHRVLGPEERVEACRPDADRDHPLALCGISNVCKYCLREVMVMTHDSS